MSWEAYIAGGRTDSQLLNRLIEPTIPRVRACATRFATKQHMPAMRDDFSQAGCMALVKCAKTYEPGKGTKFWTWSYPQVRFAMFDVMRASDMSSRVMRSRIQKRKRVEYQLATSASCRPSTEEIDMVAGTERCVSLVVTSEFHRSHEDDGWLEELAPDGRDLGAVEQLCLEEDIRQIKQRMADDLTMDQACLLWLHVARGVEQGQLAKLIGVSKSSVARTLSEAVSALRRDPVEVALWEAVEELG
jgi:RNA polymerase sigma factor (sigma-70 family)